MSLELFAHPFSSYCQKVLIALWTDGTEFEYRLLEQDHPENFADLKQRWPFGKFPVLVDDEGAGRDGRAERLIEVYFPANEGRLTATLVYPASEPRSAGGLCHARSVGDRQPKL